MIYLFLPYVIIEILVFIWAIDEFGFLFVIAEIILSAVLGFFILSNLNQSISESLMALRERKLSPAEYIGMQFSSVLGAFLLILPGILGDVVGVLLQFKFLLVFLGKGNFQESQNFGSKKYDDDVIDVEVIDDNKKIKE